MYHLCFSFTGVHIVDNFCNSSVPCHLHHWIYKSVAHCCSD